MLRNYFIWHSYNIQIINYLYKQFYKCQNLNGKYSFLKKTARHHKMKIKYLFLQPNRVIIN
jgi:hypothetical protein